MMSSLRFLHAASAALAMGGCVLLAGCASSPSATTAATPGAAPAPEVPTPIASGAIAADQPPPPKGIPLSAGMTQDEVHELLGTPLQVQVMDVDGVKADVWVYHRRIDARVRQITTGTREVPYVDPISGLTKMIQEPIIGYVTESNEVELKLLMFQGKLLNWREVVIGQDKTFSG